MITEQLDIQIVAIGSSRGIRIPKKIIDKLGFKDHAIATITENSITLKPSRIPREGWEADAKRCHELGADRSDIADDLDSDLWRDL